MERARPLDADLADVRAVCGVFLESGELWAPNTYVAPGLQSRLRRRRARIIKLIAASDIRVCPSPGLHRRNWKFAGRGIYQCETCQRLQPEVS